MRKPILLVLLLTVALPLAADVLAVADRGGTSIRLLDPATMQVVATVGVGLDPHEIAIGADGRYAYVSNYGGSYGNTLSVVDLQTRTKVKDISISPLVGPHGILWAAGKIWFTTERSRAIGRYDPRTERVDWIGRTNQNGSHMLAVRADGSVAYTANMTPSTASTSPWAAARRAFRRRTSPSYNGRKGSPSRLTARSCGSAASISTASPSSTPQPSG